MSLDLSAAASTAVECAVKRLTQWVEVLAHAPQTGASELSVLLGFEGRLVFGKNVHTLVAPIEGVAEVRFFTNVIVVERVELDFAPALTTEAPASASGRWQVDVSTRVTNDGRIDQLSLVRKLRGPQTLEPAAAFTFALLSAIRMAIPEEPVVLLAKGDRLHLSRIRGVRLGKLDEELKRQVTWATSIGVPVQMPGQNLEEWAQVTHDTIAERVDAAGARAQMLGQLAGALLKVLHRIEACAAFAELKIADAQIDAERLTLNAARDAAHAALTRALREAGTRELAEAASRVDRWLADAPDATATSFVSWSGVYLRHQQTVGHLNGALRHISTLVNSLTVVEPPGMVSGEEQSLERQIFEAPSDITLRLSWGALARARNEPRGMHVVSSLASRPYRSDDQGRPQWREALEALGAQRVHFFAGFADSIVIPVDALLKNAAAIFAAAPLRGMTVVGSLLGKLERFFAIPQLARLTVLGVGSTGLDDLGLEALLRHTPGLHSLDVSSNALTLGGLEMLCARRPPFQTLRVAGNAFEDPSDVIETIDDYHQRASSTHFGARLEARFGAQPWMHT